MIIELTHSRLNGKSYYFLEIPNILFKRVNEDFYNYLSSCGNPKGMSVVSLKDTGVKTVRCFEVSGKNYQWLLKKYNLS